MFFSTFLKGSLHVYRFFFFWGGGEVFAVGCLSGVSLPRQLEEERLKRQEAEDQKGKLNSEIDT